MPGFWDRFLRKKTEAKGLTVTLAPGGFVNEIQTTIMRGTKATYGADTYALQRDHARQ